MAHTPITCIRSVDTLPRAGTPVVRERSAVLKHSMLARAASGFFTYLPYMLQFSAQYKIYQIHMPVCRTIECPYDGMPVDQNAQNRRNNARMPIFNAGGSAPLTRRRQPRRGTIPHRSCLPRPTASAFPSQGRRRHNHRHRHSHRSDHPGFHQKC